MSRLLVAELGLVPYGQALERQRALADDRIAGRLSQDMLLLLEHPPVVTLGRGTRGSSLPIAPELLARRGIEVFEIERGGDVTYHGPGQLVAYPIFDLAAHQQDLHWFLRQLEEVLITALRQLGLPAERNAGYTGVWTRGRKIASIGIHVRQWVTWHGFALNVTTDLSAFDLIVPCGIQNVVMTSVAGELRGRVANRGADVNRGTEAQRHSELGALARDAVIGAFVGVFGFESAEPVSA